VRGGGPCRTLVSVTPFPVIDGLADAELQAAVLDGECYRLGGGGGGGGRGEKN